jgi:hypothetical protein
LIRKTQPYAKRTAHKGIWVEPKLLAEIARSRPPGRSDIRSSRDCARFCDHCRSSADMPGTGAPRGFEKQNLVAIWRLT